MYVQVTHEVKNRQLPAKAKNLNFFITVFLFVKNSKKYKAKKKYY